MKRTEQNFTQIDLVELRVRTETKLIKMAINAPHVTERMQDLVFENIKFKKYFERIDAYYKKNEFELNNNLIESILSSLSGGTPNDAKELKELSAQMEFTDDEFKFHHKTLTELVAKRQLTHYLDETYRRLNTTEDLRKILNVGDRISALGDKIGTGASKSVPALFALNSLSSKVKKAFETGESEENVPISIDVVADVLHSFAPNDLVVIAARPSVGKTAFGVNFCYNSNLPCGFVSSEMTAEQLVGRLVSCETGLDSKLIKNPQLMNEDEHNTFQNAVKKLVEIKGDSIHIDETGNIKIDQIEEDVEEWCKTSGVRFIVVDYAQRLESDRQHSSRSEAVGHVTKRLKSLAKEYGITVILLAQINRDAVKGDRRPQVHDIKDCGEIEQEADIILLLHKPTMGTAAQNDPHVVEIIIGKNRNGSIGTIISEFEPKRMSFNRPTTAQIASAQSHYSKKAA